MSPANNSQFHIVVSAENCAYMAWQCKLFHFSCVTRLKICPVFVVHELEEEWHPYFSEIVAAGGIVRWARSYRKTKDGNDYSPRNTAGSLREAAAIGYGRNDFIVLCDPDMIFVKDFAFPSKLASEQCYQLDFDLPVVKEAASQLGIDADILSSREAEIAGSVPHVFPLTYAEEFALMWLEAIDAFPAGEWQTSMYAFGLSLLRLGLKVKHTHFVALNDEQYLDVGSARIIHYAYGDKDWNKRNYWTNSNVHTVWKPKIQVPRTIILGEVISQIREASDFYQRPKSWIARMPDA
jgi:hypothetical protein